MTKVDIPMKNKLEATSNLIQNEKDVEVQVRAPTRVLHFSDGTMEEFSDDGQDQVDADATLDVDESKMNWSDWMLHKTCKLGSSVLAGCDYVGEGLASFLGITTPKYSFEIEEFKRMQAEQNAEDHAIKNFVEQNRSTSETGEPSPSKSTAVTTMTPPLTNSETTVNPLVGVTSEIEKY